MCGRFLLTKAQHRLALKLGIPRHQIEAFFNVDRYNVAPTQDVPVFRVSRETNAANYESSR